MNPTRLLASLLIPALLAGCGARATAPAIPRSKAQAAPRAASVAGAARPVSYLTQLGAQDPATAATGQALAFAVPGRGIMVATLDGANPRAIAVSQPGDHDPAWTAAGDLLVAVRDAGAGASLMKLPPAGAAAPLYTATAALSDPAWIPGAGGWLVVEGAGAQARLVQVPANGGAARPVCAAAGLASPTVAPDGRTAIVERQGAAGTELARLDLATGALTALPVAGKHPRAPRLAPSGQQLAYVADEGLMVGDASGAGAKLVSGDRGFGGLAWHPATGRLVAGAHEGTRTDLLRVDL